MSWVFSLIFPGNLLLYTISVFMIRSRSNYLAQEYPRFVSTFENCPAFFINSLRFKFIELIVLNPDCIKVFSLFTSYFVHGNKCDK